MADDMEKRADENGWLPIATAPRTRPFLAFNRGQVDREIPDWTGFFQGCDQGPDVVTVKARDHAFMCSFETEENGFIDDIGEVYHINGLSKDFLEDDPIDDESLRLVGWQDLPKLPEPPAQQEQSQ